MIATQKKRNWRKEKKTRLIKWLELSETPFPNLPLAYGGSGAKPLMTRFIWSRFSLSGFGYLSLLLAIKEKDTQEASDNIVYVQMLQYPYENYATWQIQTLTCFNGVKDRC